MLDSFYSSGSNMVLFLPSGMKRFYYSKYYTSPFRGGVYEPEDNVSYAVYADNKLSFYCDKKYESREGIIFYNLYPNSSTDKWGNYGSDIRKIVFHPSFAEARPTSTANWFSGCKYVEEIEGMENLNTSRVTSMYAMFSGTGKYAGNLKTLDLSSFSTSKVTDMSYMFNNCTSVSTIYISDGWDTSLVSNSNNMFNYCRKLTGGDGTRYNKETTDKTLAYAGDGGYMTTLALPSVKEIYAVYNDNTLSFYFDNRSSRHSGDVYTDLVRKKSGDQWGVHKLDIKRVVFNPSFTDARPVSTAHWFNGCKNLVCIEGLEYLNTSKVTSMYGMFNGVGQLSGKITELDLSGFDTHNVTDMKYMFNCCTSLKTIYVSDGWTTANVEESDNMFYNCKSITGGDGTTYYANYTDKARAFAGLGGYLTTKETNVKSHTYDDGDLEMAATSIENAGVDGRNASTIYTMQGTLVGQDIDIKSLPKGLYIINEKKIFVK